jgi:hypothetical protein
MNWTRNAGFISVVLLVTACRGEDKGGCSLDSDCPEGMWCDTALALCVSDCTKAQCLDGHFCDPKTKLCVAECPFMCPASPENGTVMCDDKCTIACNSEYHLCTDRCASDTDATACGVTCEQCTTIDPNAEPTCESDACSSKCKMGFRSSETGCVACPGGDCSTIQPIVTTMFNSTELIWQGCAAGFVGNDCLIETGTEKAMDWETAGLYCSSLTWHGYSGDWRLPTQPSSDEATGELGSILVACPGSPTIGNACIDNSAFPNTPADRFWSSSFSSDTYAWAVNFGDGNAFNGGLKRLPFHVRCVRSGP